MFTYAAVALALACFTPTLVPSQQTVVEAASVKLNKSKATLIKGRTLQLKVTGTKKTVKWKSSNKKIATVSSKHSHLDFCTYGFEDFRDFLPLIRQIHIRFSSNRPF